jgi:hypothetical protein
VKLVVCKVFFRRKLEMLVKHGLEGYQAIAKFLM